MPFQEKKIVICILNDIKNIIQNILNNILLILDTSLIKNSDYLFELNYL